jgi:hypothetical protein
MTTPARGRVGRGRARATPSIGRRLRRWPGRIISYSQGDRRARPKAMPYAVHRRDLPAMENTSSTIVQTNTLGDDMSAVGYVAQLRLGLSWLWGGAVRATGWQPREVLGGGGRDGEARVRAPRLRLGFSRAILLPGCLSTMTSTLRTLDRRADDDGDARPPSRASRANSTTLAACCHVSRGVATTTASPVRRGRAPMPLCGRHYSAVLHYWTMIQPLVSTERVQRARASQLLACCSVWSVRSFWTLQPPATATAAGSSLSPPRQSRERSDRIGPGSSSRRAFRPHRRAGVSSRLCYLLDAFPCFPSSTFCSADHAATNLVSCSICCQGTTLVVSNHRHQYFAYRAPCTYVCLFTHRC